MCLHRGRCAGLGVLCARVGFGLEGFVKGGRKNAFSLFLKVKVGQCLLDFFILHYHLSCMLADATIGLILEEPCLCLESF